MDNGWGAVSLVQGVMEEVDEHACRRDVLRGW